MNKIYLDMLSKSEMLAEGISRNAKELASKNIHINTEKILSLGSVSSSVSGAGPSVKHYTESCLFPYAV